MRLSVVVALPQFVQLSVKPGVIAHTLRVTAMGPLELNAKMNVDESRAPFPPGQAMIAIRSGQSIDPTNLVQCRRKLRWVIWQASCHHLLRREIVWQDE